MMKMWEKSTLDICFSVPNSDTFTKQRMSNLKEDVSNDQIALIQKAIATVSDNPLVYAASNVTYRHVLVPGEDQ